MQEVVVDDVLNHISLALARSIESVDRIEGAGTDHMDWFLA